ncbi:MAG: trehalose-6-phosphate synthase [Candidatus Krumholzibacteria bacterium]|jgi:trehalose 6-phosphate synthase|nr:trehalose-6-phosphate synthase [Candidatus Krumholzibacteria bacterium]
MTGKGRLLIVSNRLPLMMEEREGNWFAKPGAGGLVTALAPVLRDRGGVWIGWPGTTEAPSVRLRQAIGRAVADTGYDLVPVFLDATEKHFYYRVFANEVIWPLFHDMTSRCRFRPEAWDIYGRVSARFAGAVGEHLQTDDFVWIHDYHLMQVARHLREAKVEQRLAFFLHIPFPPLDIFTKLPWRRQLLADLLAFDLVGFQTQRDRRNFARCVSVLLPDVASVRTRGGYSIIQHRQDKRRVLIGVFPIGIDQAGFARDAAAPPVAERAWYLHENYPERQIVLGVDRLDYTKGVPEKLEAFRYLLQRWPQHNENVTLVQVVVPSRWEIPHYEQLKQEIERLVGEINGEFSRPGWVPVHYHYRALARDELLAYYRTAEILIASPWKDGMNLVAKEYCACDIEERGVLLLSEFAGAAAQLHRYAIMFNPHDITGMAEAIHQALDMPEDERRRRMRGLRRNVRAQDVFWWVDRFLQVALQRRLQDFPVIDEFVPGGSSLAAET